MRSWCTSKCVHSVYQVVWYKWMKIDVFSSFCIPSTVQIRRKWLPGVHSDRVWHVYALLKPTNLVISGNTKLSESQKIQSVSDCLKKGHLYLVVQKASSMLKAFLGTNQSTWMPNRTHCDDCMIPFSGRDLKNLSRVLNFQHRRNLVWGKGSKCPPLFFQPRNSLFGYLI
jgi:hypothetical protein